MIANDSDTLRIITAETLLTDLTQPHYSSNRWFLWFRPFYWRHVPLTARVLSVRSLAVASRNSTPPATI